MRIRQAAAKCNLSAFRRGLWWGGLGWVGFGLDWFGPGLGCLSSSDAAPRGTVWFTVNRRLKKNARESVCVCVCGGGKVERGGNLNVISKKWIKNLCGGTKRPIEGWFITPGQGGAVVGHTALGFTKLSCNTWQVFIYAPQSESKREEEEV